MKHFAIGTDVSTAMLSDMNSHSDHDSISWCGQSGQFYTMHPERVDSFVLKGKDIYVLTSGNDILWLGTGDDIVTNTSSRACFRTALKMASTVFRLPAPGDEITAMRARWDIEGGQLAGPLELVS